MAIYRSVTKLLLLEWDVSSCKLLFLPIWKLILLTKSKPSLFLNVVISHNNRKTSKERKEKHNNNFVWMSQKKKISHNITVTLWTYRENLTKKNGLYQNVKRWVLPLVWAGLLKRLKCVMIIVALHRVWKCADKKTAGNFETLNSIDILSFITTFQYQRLICIKRHTRPA